MRSLAKIMVATVIAAAFGVSGQMILSHADSSGPTPIPSDLVHPPPGPAGIAYKLPWGCMPPPGTPSNRIWTGPDSHGIIHTFTECNCNESINFFTAGDPNKYAYHDWPMEHLDKPDNPACWDTFENSLRIGNVVEFIALVHEPSGFDSRCLYHVHICAGAHGLMAGANNEPRFEIALGVPLYTQRWGLCTSREYFSAVRKMDPAWKACGYPRTYSVLVYRHPWWASSIAAVPAAPPHCMFESGGDTWLAPPSVPIDRLIRASWGA